MAEQRSPRQRRARAGALAGALLALPGAGAAAELPTGFGGIEIGDAWTSAESLHPFREVADASSRWDRYIRECGYRAVVVDAGDGRLLVTVNDFVVTGLSYATPLEPGTDVMEVAQTVLDAYGQPDVAVMRDVYGSVTIDPGQVNYVTLEYEAPDAVRFSVSGRSLWSYQIQVEHEHRRWHENRTAQCARELDRAADAAAGDG